MEKRLLEQIDACRRGMEGLRDPGSSASARSDPAHSDRSHSEPALRDLAEAVARGDARVLRMLAQVEVADAAISAVLHDVPVPRDLADRLLVALKAAEHGEPVDAAALRRSGCGSSAAAAQLAAGTREVSLTQPAADAIVQPAFQTKRTTRRAWLGWTLAGATAAAAAVALFCALYPWAPEWVSAEAIAQHIYVMYDSEIALIEPDAWTPGAPVSEPPVFDEILLPQPQRWRELMVGRYPATAYDLVGEGAPKRATLLVIDRRVRGLDHAPPEVPADTQGRCIGVWQSETQVFALIVEGTVSDYQRFIRPQAIA